MTLTIPETAKLVVVAEVDVERVLEIFVAVNFESVLSHAKPATPPERRAGLAPVVVQKGTRPEVSAEEVPTVPEPPPAEMVLQPKVLPDHVRAFVAPAHEERPKPLMFVPERLVVVAEVPVARVNWMFVTVSFFREVLNWKSVEVAKADVSFAMRIEPAFQPVLGLGRAVPPCEMVKTAATANTGTATRPMLTSVRALKKLLSLRI